MKSLHAHLLVAAPQLPDPNFYRTVVLMIQHDEDGAFGVVLNRPSDITIGEIWEQVAHKPCDSLDPINLGGPVEGPLMAIHTQESYSENEILPGVFLAMQKEYLNKIVQQKDRPFRLFSGYAGWAGGQLENELEVGGWLTTPATYDYIFRHPDDLWKQVASDIGNDILFSTQKHKRPLPDDPSLN
jgi:putative transcriptional regulator